MKRNFLLVALMISSAVSAEVVLSTKADEHFGGYWVDVEATQKSLSSEWKRPVSIGDVVAIQRTIRVCLQEKSKSFFRADQTAHLSECVNSAKANAVNTKSVVPPTTGLTVVFDMDETLLTQWHQISKDHPERTTLQPKHLDSTISEKDRIMTMAPKGVTVRPGVLKMLTDLSRMYKIERIYMFSAREDKSAEELRDYFLAQVPTLKMKFGGLFARNSLRLDGALTTPSKDLRIISPDLNRIILIDDNPARVMQKQLSFTIPQFNADAYLEAQDHREIDVLKAINAVTVFTTSMIYKVSLASNPTATFYPYSQAAGTSWRLEILKSLGYTEAQSKDLVDRKVYDQPWVGGEVIKF